MFKRASRRSTAGIAVRLAMLTAVGAQTACATPVRDTSDAARVLDVAEAVFRFQMGENASNRPVDAGLYCLEFRMGATAGRQDPPAALLMRFAKSVSLVRPGSKCRIGDDRDGNLVLDVETERQGTILSVRNIECATADRCTVEGGQYQANLSARANTYIVERRGRSWRVTGDELRAIS